MKLVRLSANKESFRTVHFHTGLNIVLAERTQLSRETDSRNGVGKTTLMQIIDFCLGATGPVAGAGQGLAKLSGGDWTFSLTVDLNGQQMMITRAVDDGGTFTLAGHYEALGLDPAEPTLEDPHPEVKVGSRAYTDALGSLCFGLEPAKLREQYAPTFRQLFGHFFRYRNDAFISPFEAFGKPPAEQPQVNNTFLLGLDWHIATEWQRLKDRGKTLTALGKQGIEDATAELGELESRRVRLQSRMRALEDQVSTFRVIPEYRALEIRLNEGSRRMRDITNEVTILAGQVELYQSEVQASSGDGRDIDVEGLFEEAGLALPSQVVRTLEEVRKFHVNVNRNRRSYLEGEITRIDRTRHKLEAELRALEDQRVADMSRLSQGGALDEHSKLQQDLGSAAGELQSLNQRIAQLRALRAGKAALRKEELAIQDRAQLDLDERRPILAPAIQQFSTTFERLYGEPADLIVDVGPNNYRFQTHLPRDGSHGIGKISVLAYDLSLAHSLRMRGVGPGLLAHDSIVFDGVDERQAARALHLLLGLTTDDDLQYLVTINSDDAPRTELEGLGISMDEHVTLTLTDADPSGSLLGIRF